MTDKLCYIYASFVVLRAFGAVKAFDTATAFDAGLWCVNFSLLKVSGIPESVQILLVQSLLGPSLGKVLLLVGIGIVLRRLLPVIEESKTLV